MLFEDVGFPDDKTERIISKSSNSMSNLKFGKTLFLASWWTAVPLQVVRRSFEQAFKVDWLIPVKYSAQPSIPWPQAAAKPFPFQLASRVCVRPQHSVRTTAWESGAILLYASVPPGKSLNVLDHWKPERSGFLLSLTLLETYTVELKKKRKLTEMKSYFNLLKGKFYD